MAASRTGDLVLAPDALVERIAALQSTGDDGYAEGLFPAQRTHRYLPYCVEDDSIFFTAVVLYTLQQVQAHLSAGSRRRIDEIARKAVANYPRYRNNEGQPMYNFWQTLPEDRFFPNGRILSRWRHFRLPEDIDTTAYVYLTQPHPAQDLAWLKERLKLDTNGRRRHIRNTLPRYRHLRAYSTWLGQANMPLDFDVCALSNLLLLIFANGLPLNEHDRDTIQFITSVIRDDDHLRHPFAVAPWYADPTVILYHVARLAASCDVPELAACQDHVARDLERLLAGRPPLMQRVLLSTSLMRLGRAPAPLAYPDDLDGDLEGFHFFVGGLLTALDNPVTRALARFDVFHLRYRCPAHSLALLLEHQVYRMLIADHP